MMGSLPTTADLQKLADSYLTPELIAAAEISRVDSLEGAQIVGKQARNGYDFSGLIFPYRWPGQSSPREYRLRRDQPDLEQKPDGSIREKGKYLSPPGKGNLFFFPPDTHADDLADSAVALTITEGEKKALALARFYTERGERQIVVGLPGVWNWRGTIGKTTNANGSRQDVKGVIPDFDRIDWKKREVLIVFDANAASNESVSAARRELTKELRRRGATVRVVDLPAAEGVNGVDDLLALKGAAFVADLFEQAEEFTLSAVKGFEERDGSIYWVKFAGTDSVQLTNFSAQIVGDVLRDDGAEESRQFEIEARLSDSLEVRTGVVTAEEFEAMRWPGRLLGARAVVWPGQKERASVAIRLLSNGVSNRRVVTHSGWCNDGDDWCYYHAGGAIDASGLSEAEVDLPAPLSPVDLPVPPTGDRLREAMRAVAFDLPAVAPESIMLPLIGAAFAAVLTEADFSAFLFGYTGTGKSELAALIQALFGRSFHAKNLPGSWSSTANSLESIAHSAKDCVLVVDDFCPQGPPTEQAKLHAAADRLHRAQGNHSGRMRARTDGSVRPPKPPRGLVISTGEDLPRGQSLRARLAILQVEKDAVRWTYLTLCQKQAREGLYAEAMAAFLQWLATDGRIGTLRAGASEHISELRDSWLEGNVQAHKRSATTLACLERSWKVWLAFATEAGALDGDEVTGLRESLRAALEKFGDAQDAYQVSESPAPRFIELIRAAIASGKAHVTDLRGGQPQDTDGQAVGDAWGWRDGQPQGERIGWLDVDDLYLQPDAAYKSAQGATVTGEGLTVGSKTLWKRLREAGLLASTDGDDGQTVRKQTGDGRARVLHLKAEKISHAT